MDCQGRQGYGPCLRLATALRLAIHAAGEGSGPTP